MPSLTVVDTSGTSYTLTLSGDVSKLKVDTLVSFVQSSTDSENSSSFVLTYGHQRLLPGRRCGEYGIGEGAVVHLSRSPPHVVGPPMAAAVSSAHRAVPTAAPPIPIVPSKSGTPRSPPPVNSSPQPLQVAAGSSAGRVSPPPASAARSLQTAPASHGVSPDVHVTQHLSESTKQQTAYPYPVENLSTILELDSPVSRDNTPCTASTLPVTAAPHAGLSPRAAPAVPKSRGMSRNGSFTSNHLEPGAALSRSDANFTPTPERGVSTTPAMSVSHTPQHSAPRVPSRRASIARLDTPRERESPNPVAYNLETPAANREGAEAAGKSSRDDQKAPSTEWPKDSRDGSFQTFQPPEASSVPRGDDGSPGPLPNTPLGCRPISRADSFSPAPPPARLSRRASMRALSPSTSFSSYPVFVAAPDDQVHNSNADAPTPLLIRSESTTSPPLQSQASESLGVVASLPLSLAAVATREGQRTNSPPSRPRTPVHRAPPCVSSPANSSPSIPPRSALTASLPECGQRAGAAPISTTPDVLYDVTHDAPILQDPATEHECMVHDSVAIPPPGPTRTPDSIQPASRPSDSPFAALPPPLKLSRRASLKTMSPSRATPQPDGAGDDVGSRPAVDNMVVSGSTLPAAVDVLARDEAVRSTLLMEEALARSLIERGSTQELTMLTAAQEEYVRQLLAEQWRALWLRVLLSCVRENETLGRAAVLEAFTVAARRLASLVVAEEERVRVLLEGEEAAAWLSKALIPSVLDKEAVTRYEVMREYALARRLPPVVVAEEECARQDVVDEEAASWLSKTLIPSVLDKEAVTRSEVVREHALARRLPSVVLAEEECARQHVADEEAASWLVKTLIPSVLDKEAIGRSAVVAAWHDEALRSTAIAQKHLDRCAVENLEAHARRVHLVTEFDAQRELLQKKIAETLLQAAAAEILREELSQRKAVDACERLQRWPFGVLYAVIEEMRHAEVAKQRWVASAHEDVLRLEVQARREAALLELRRADEEAQRQLLLLLAREQRDTLQRNTLAAEEAAHRRVCEDEEAAAAGTSLADARQQLEDELDLQRRFSEAADRVLRAAAEKKVVATTAVPCASPKSHRRDGSPASARLQLLRRGGPASKPQAGPSARGPSPSLRSSAVRTSATDAAGSPSPSDPRSALAKYQQLVGASRQSPSPGAKRSNTPGAKRGASPGMSRSAAPSQAAQQASPVQARLAALKTTRERLLRIESVFSHIDDVRMQSALLEQRNAAMRAEVSLEQRRCSGLSSALSEAKVLEGELAARSAQLREQQEHNAMLLHGLSRLVDLADYVVRPLASQEAKQLQWLAPSAPQEDSASLPYLLLHALHHEEMNGVARHDQEWTSLAAAAEAYGDACRLERAIYAELHGRVEKECLMQVNKSKAMTEARQHHAAVLEELRAQRRTLQNRIRDDSIILRRKGIWNFVEVAEQQPLAVDGDAGGLLLEGAPKSVAEGDEAPVPVSLPAPSPHPRFGARPEDLASVEEQLAAARHEYDSLAAVHHARTAQYLETRRRLERESLHLKNVLRAHNKEHGDLSQLFRHLNERVHGMDPDEIALEEVLVRREEEEAAQDVETTPSVERGATRSKSPAKPARVFVSSGRPVSATQGPTIASLARTEAIAAERHIVW